MSDLPIVSAGAEYLARFGLKPKYIEVLDSSMLGCFMDCPSKFYLRYICGLKPSGTGFRNANLAWGSAWHEVMFAFMEGYGERTWDERIQDGLEALETHYPEWLTAEFDSGRNGRKRSKLRMAEQFFAYVELWKDMEPDYQILRNEQYFDVMKDAIGLRWCGRIDSVRRVVRNKKVRVWDYKTTKSMGDSYFDQFEMSFQFPGYVWSVNQMTTERVYEITVDVMYTVTKSFDFFQRTFRYDEARLAEWERNVKMIVDRIMYLQDNYLHEPEAWAKNWGACTTYGKCTFFPVHSLNPRGEGRLLTLRDDYQISRWDPANVAGEEED